MAMLRKLPAKSNSMLLIWNNQIGKHKHLNIYNPENKNRNRKDAEKCNATDIEWFCLLLLLLLFVLYEKQKTCIRGLFVDFLWHFEYEDLWNVKQSITYQSWC